MNAKRADELGAALALAKVSKLTCYYCSFPFQKIQFHFCAREFWSSPTRAPPICRWTSGG